MANVRAYVQLSLSAAVDALGARRSLAPVGFGTSDGQGSRPHMRMSCFAKSISAGASKGFG